MRADGKRSPMVRRLAALMRYLHGRRYAPDLKCLARGLNVSERTIRRDLAALDAAGFSIPRWRYERD